MSFLGRRAMRMPQILYCPCGFGNLYAHSAKEQKLPFCIIRSLSKSFTIRSPEQADSSKSVNFPTVKKYLSNIGGNAAKIQKEIKLPLEDLQEKVKSSAVILEELCRLDKEDVCHMVSKRPRILLLNVRQIEHCVEMLKNVGLKEQNIATMLKKCPGILTSRIENTLEEKARHNRTKFRQHTRL